MATVSEILPDVFRICTYFSQNNLEFNEFLVRDEQPLLYHTGPRKTFAEVCEAVRKVMDPAKIRWIGFSHFEADECGALNAWLAIAPQAEPICSVVAANVSINDFADRPARGLLHDELISTGRHRFRMLRTPHVPHGWEASLLFEETRRILFCSDLFHQGGQHPPVTESDVVEAAARTLREYQLSPMANSMPYTPYTDRIFAGLAALRPEILALAHGPTYRGDGAKALRGLAAAIKDVLAGYTQWP